jgi:hypothetical protein
LNFGEQTHCLSSIGRGPQPDDYAGYEYNTGQYEYSTHEKRTFTARDGAHTALDTEVTLQASQLAKSGDYTKTPRRDPQLMQWRFFANHHAAAGERTARVIALWGGGLRK